MLKWAHNPELRPANAVYVTQNSIEDVSDSVSLSDLSDVDKTINNKTQRKKKKAKRSLSMRTPGLLGISKYYDSGSSDWTPFKRVKSLLSINEEPPEEEEVDPLLRGLIEYEQKMIRQLSIQNASPEDTIDDKFKVLWRGRGLPLHLVDNQWTMLGDNTLQNIEIVLSEVRNSYMVTADGVQDSVIIDNLSDQVGVKKSSDTSVSLWFNESFVAIKFQTTEDATNFLSILEDIISGTYLADYQDDDIMMDDDSLDMVWGGIQEMSSDLRCFTQEISSLKARIHRLEKEVEHSQGGTA